jgi:hypothetical protein
VTLAGNVNSSIELIGQLIRAQTKDNIGVTLDKRVLQTQMSTWRCASRAP